MSIHVSMHMHIRMSTDTSMQTSAHMTKRVPVCMYTHTNGAQVFAMLRAFLGVWVPLAIDGATHLSDAKVKRILVIDVPSQL